MFWSGLSNRVTAKLVMWDKTLCSVHYAMTQTRLVWTTCRGVCVCVAIFIRFYSRLELDRWFLVTLMGIVIGLIGALLKQSITALITLQWKQTKSYLNVRLSFIWTRISSRQHIQQLGPLCMKRCHTLYVPGRRNYGVKHRTKLFTQIRCFEKMVNSGTLYNG